MGRLALCAALVVAFPFAETSGVQTSDDYSITIDPDNPKRGDTVTYGYTGTLPVRIKVTFDDGSLVEFELTAANPTYDIVLPPNAFSLVATDETNGTPALVTAVS